MFLKFRKIKKVEADNYEIDQQIKMLNSQISAISMKQTINSDNSSERSVSRAGSIEKSATARSKSGFSSKKVF